MKKAWYFGNTTVRSALRLRDGLLVIQNYQIEGKIRGSEGDSILRDCLGDAEVVVLGDDETNSVGRKWRSAMEKMGFLIPNLPHKHFDIQKEIGPADFISKNGKRLIESNSLQVWQECFLRALSAYRIPDNTDTLSFSPFSFVLKVMLELKERSDSSKINKDEMALFIELSWSNDDIEQVVQDILDFRNHLSSLNPGTDRKNYINGLYKKTNLNPITLKNDYADTNFKYLKASGLFKSSRTSILLDEDKLFLIKELSNNFWKPDTLFEYYQGLCDGAPLPTDNLSVAIQTAETYINKLTEYDVNTDIAKKILNNSMDIAEINSKRYELEDSLFRVREAEFARNQVNEVGEIVGYLNLLLNNKYLATLTDGTEIEIPRSERPAYFEWVIWRVFLAINSIITPPWESRNFKVDPDFKPISHAVSGGSDLIFEFNDFILVVEVTLTQSSRQEAAEGEPVRRHVADIVQKFPDKQVFGLFLAN